MPKAARLAAKRPADGPIRLPLPLSISTSLSPVLTMKALMAVGDWPDGNDRAESSLPASAGGHT